MEKLLKKIFISFVNIIKSNPKLRMVSMKIFNHFPGLKGRLKRVEKRYQYSQTKINYINGPDQLSSQAKKIYKELKKVIVVQEENK